MQVIFNGNCRIDGVFYRKKIEYTVDDALKDHWFFQACVEKGRVQILDGSAAAPAAPAKKAKK